MVEIEEVASDDNKSAATVAPSQERLLDAAELESVASSLKRPTARMQLESLAKKLRKEAAALKIVEQANGGETPAAPIASAVPPAPTAAAPKPLPTPSKPATAPTTGHYATVDRFAFDAGGYDGKFVTLYIPLPTVGDLPKDQITCTFTPDSFDLIVQNLKGKSYRLFKDHLEHEILPEKSKHIVKADKVVVKLAKKKGEYSYDHWSKLTDPKKKAKSKTSKDNPMASLNEMMQEMYENGDDKMRKMIGETMMKQRTGELNNEMGGFGKGGMGDLGMGGGLDDDDFGDGI